MKNTKIIISLFVTMFLIASCQKETTELGTLPDKSTIKFSVSQDRQIDAGGNTVILKNETPGIVPMWDYGTGRSNRVLDTVRFAFKGSYIIRFSAATSAGIVKCDSVVVEVTEDNLTYVNDPLWTALTGGVGKSKTWIPDNGKYGLASGPLAYGDPSIPQVWGNFKPNWEPSGSDIGIKDVDYQTEMTFSLIGGPYMTTVKPNESTGNESGTFYLNVSNHTLSTTDATIVRPSDFISKASNWTSSVNILVLTENQLRIGIMRSNSEGPWWYILNYVSKDYAKTYVPKYVPDPNFNFGDQMNIIAGNSLTTWRMDTVTPFNWTDLTGKFLNAGWDSITDYPGWTGYDAAAVANIRNVRITFGKTGDVTLKQNDGTTKSGTFSIDETKNLVTFEGLVPSIYISGGWVTATTTSLVKDASGNVITGENQWKIVKVKSISGVTTEIWFGKRDPNKKEYMVYHFILASGIPDVKTEMIRGLCGKSTGTSSRTFKIDLNHPVDWTNLEGVGWTVAGTQDGWYWSSAIAASVKSQYMTFSQTEGVVTVTKKDEQGNITTSPVAIDADKRMITIADISIIKFGAGSWLPTSGPNYYWVRGEFNDVATSGFWIGVKSKDTEYTAYHYILK